MHLCRNMFPTILEEKGLLPKLLLEHFEPSHDLYNDLEKYSGYTIPRLVEMISSGRRKR